MKNIKIILVAFSLMLVGCSDDDDPAAGTGTVTFTEGTYTVTSVMSYGNSTCSGDGILGVCQTDESVMTEADCPTGMCMDEESDEENCPEGDWMSGMCLDDNGDGWDDEEAHVSAEACENYGGEWMALGWMSLMDLMDITEGVSVVFGADGIFSNPDGDTGTYTVDGTSIIITESDCENDDNDIDATDQAACEAAGGEWETSDTPITLNDDGTLSIHWEDESGCYDCWCEGGEPMDSDECEVLEEQACEDACGEYESASCIDMIFTLVE